MKDNDWQLPKYEIFEFKKKLTEYCICIPLLNEGEKFKKQLKKMVPYSKMADIIIADWGSTDGSTQKKFLKKYNVRTLLIKKSPGRQSTQLRMGFAYALRQGYEGIITIDGNSKDSVKNLPDFIRDLDKGYDYIQGSRFKVGGKAINTPFLRLLGIRLFFSPLLSIAAGFWFTDITNGFRAYSKKLLLHPKIQPFRNLFVRYELLFYLPVRAAQIGLKVKEIPVTRSYPKNTIPTKITGFNSHLNFLLTVIKTALNHYNPISKTTS